MIIDRIKRAMLRYHSNNRNIYLNNEHHHHPLSSISRTARYKKFTKPLLERKRRARMNRCVDELKSLFGSLEAEGENINKLEKADVLEMTVKYIKRISRMKDPIQEARRFHAGFSECASEACNFLCSLPGLNSAVSNKLVEHLKQCIAKPSRPTDTNFTAHSYKFDSDPVDGTSLSPAPLPTSPAPSSSPSPSPNYSSAQSRLSCKPLFKLSCRLDDRCTRMLNARAGASLSAETNEQRINFVWRPW